MSRVNRWLEWQPRAPHLFDNAPGGTDKTDKTSFVSFVGAVPAVSQKMEEPRTVEPEMVTLKGGLVVPRPALELLLALEARGCVVRQEQGGTLFVGPRGRVTAADAAQIRAHRDDLLVLIDYCEALQ